MPKLEADYKRAIVKEIKANSGYARRLEDMFAVGVLDTIICLPETGIFLVEVKRFSFQQFAPSPRQFEEMRRVAAAHGNTAIIGVKMPEEIYHIHGIPKDHGGRVFAKDCVIQQPGETFTQLFKRWFKETQDGRDAKKEERREHSVQHVQRRDDGAGDATRRSDVIVPDDSRSVVDVPQVGDDPPKEW